MIRLRDLEGVGTLEWRVSQLGYWDHVFESWGQDLAEHYFGVCEEDLEHIPEEKFAVRRMMRDESDAYWRAHGWDVTDGEGKQLIVMDVFLKPMVAAVEKLHPDAIFEMKASTEEWARQLEEAAKRFKPGTP